MRKCTKIDNTSTKTTNIPKLNPLTKITKSNGIFRADFNWNKGSNMIPITWPCNFMLNDIAMPIFSEMTTISITISYGIRYKTQCLDFSLWSMWLFCMIRFLCPICIRMWMVKTMGWQSFLFNDSTEKKI